jgi:glycosyltransferase involved in cell wall biosynthesis
LLHYTHNADIGISIDKNNNLNYRYSLPNKLFDYLQMGLPVLASNLPEIAAIISNYNAGEFITGYEPKELAENIQKILNSNSLQLYRKNALAAAAELTWDKEKQQLLALIDQAGA